MSARLLFLNDQKLAEAVGGAVGECSGILAPGVDWPNDRRFTRVEVDLSETKARELYCQDGVPGHLKKRWREEQERYHADCRRARSAVRPKIRAVLDEARQKRSRLDHRFVTTHVVDVPRIEREASRKLLAIDMEAVGGVRDIDPAAVIDRRKYPRRTRRVDLSKLPAPDEDGVVRCDAATLLVATVTA